MADRKLGDIIGKNSFRVGRLGREKYLNRFEDEKIGFAVNDSLNSVCEIGTRKSKIVFFRFKGSVVGYTGG